MLISKAKHELKKQKDKTFISFILIAFCDNFKEQLQKTTMTFDFE